MRLWDPVTGRAVRTIQAATGGNGGVFGVAFSPDGKLLASAGASATATVRLWDPVTGRAVRTIQPDTTGPSSGVNGVAFSPDGKLLASASAAAARDGGTVRLWDPVTGRAVRTIQATGPTARVNGVAFSPDGKLLASAGTDGTARLWDPVTGRAVRTIQAATGRNGGVFGVAFSPGRQAAGQRRRRRHGRGCGIRSPAGPSARSKPAPPAPTAA